MSYESLCATDSTAKDEDLHVSAAASRFVKCIVN